jgi:hypothetical protein
MSVMTSDRGPPRPSRPMHFQLTSFRAFWYGRVIRNSLVFHVFAWFGCSVPITRGRLKWVTVPRELRGVKESGMITFARGKPKQT